MQITIETVKTPATKHDVLDKFAELELKIDRELSALIAEYAQQQLSNDQYTRIMCTYDRAQSLRQQIAQLRWSFRDNC